MLSMRKIQEVLRLKHELHFSNRAIARSCSIPRGTVANYLERARAAGLSFRDPTTSGIIDPAKAGFVLKHQADRALGSLLLDDLSHHPGEFFLNVCWRVVST